MNVLQETVWQQILVWYMEHDENPVIYLSVDGIILAANTAACKLYGKSEKDLRGNDYFELHTRLNIEPAISKADLARKDNSKEALKKVVKIGGNLEQEIEWSFCKVASSKDILDSVFILRGKNSVNMEALDYLDQLNRKIVGAAAPSYNTIEGYENSVKYHYERIIACMPGNVYWMDSNSVYLGCNDNCARMLGFSSRHEIVGKTYDELSVLGNWKEGQGDSFRRDDLEVINTGIAKLNVEEPPITDIKGSVLHFLTSRVPILDQNNKITGVVGISIDISERKKMEEDLKKAKEQAEIANKAKTEFLENMRHDIRTSLSGIVGVSELLNGELDKSKILEFTASLDKASKELLRFLNEVLESINVASGEIPLLKKKFSLREILTNVIELHKPFAIEKQLVLSLFIDENIPPFLIGDPIRIYRIVLELLVNALKFTKEGYVTVFATLGERIEKNLVIKISIEDTGVGISAEKQQDLFIRFKRLTPSYEGIYKGAGLGLSIIKQFLEDLDGEIYVDSQLNKGTKFVCLIPVKEPLLKGDPFKDTTPPIEIRNMLENCKSKRQDKRNFRKYGLIVEDQPIAALVEKTLLVEQGCEVDIVEDGKTAINQVRKFQYDFIIMDIGLPDIDGYEVTKNIRSFEANSKHRTFIIGLTGHAGADKKQFGLDAGMNVVLSKPLTHEVFAHILETCFPEQAVGK